MCTARSPRELLRDYISTFIAIYFEDFFDIFITISKLTKSELRNLGAERSPQPSPPHVRNASVRQCTALLILILILQQLK